MFTKYDNVFRPNRLFSCRKAQGTSSEIMEVGDLSRRENKFDKAVVGLFSNHDDGQHRRKRSPQAAIGQAPISTPAKAGGVTEGTAEIRKSSCT